MRINSVDGTSLRAGMASDGVTPSTQFLFGETPESCAEKGGVTQLRALSGFHSRAASRQPIW